jgi:hypothetical protein
MKTKEILFYILIERNQSDLKKDIRFILLNEYSDSLQDIQLHLKVETFL